MDKTILFENIFNQIPEGIVVINQEGKIVLANNHFFKLIGKSPKNVSENNTIISFIKEKDPLKYKDIISSLNNNFFWEGELWIEKADIKKLIPIFCKFIYFDKYIIEILNDISEVGNHKEMINFIKYHDLFLKIPNKFFLKEKLKNKLNLNEKFTIAIITINNLKKINDSLGRDIGDKILLYISKTIKKTLDKRGFLFYFESNQFIVVFDTIDTKKIVQIIDDIFKRLSTPITINNFSDIIINLTSGIYIVKKYEKFNSVIHKLQIVNEVAKNSGKKCLFYKPEYKDNLITKHKIENLIKSALKFKRFVLYYQPRINIKNNKIESVEALIRIVSREKQLISPGLFIPIAEESNLINKIGDWTFKQIIEDARYITMKTAENIHFSFNVSANQFLEPDFVDKLENIYKLSQDYASNFEIEITEWALMKNTENSIKKMHELKKYGFNLIIDDFGTGYSSLSYLKEFPIDSLKIDKSFTDGIPKEPKTISIVNAIIFLAKQLNLKITAEGVEDAKQVNWFAENSCDEIQGYFFSKPLTKYELIKLIKIFNKVTPKNKFIKWDEKFSTGICAFDSHRMIILNTLNKIFEEIHDKDVDIIEIKQYLTILYQYIAIHLKEEENYLKEKNFPDLNEHIAKHREFETKIAKILHDFGKGKKKLEKELFTILKDWFLKHILKYDRKYFQDKS